MLMLPGEPDRALGYLENNAAHPETGNAPTECPMFTAAFYSIRGTPRSQALVRKRNTTGLRVATACAASQ